MKKVYSQILLIVSAILFVFLFDWAFFQKLQFRIPNESPWNTNHFFNFLYEYERLARTPKTKPRILILGSSIAYYSFDAKLLENSLKDKTGKDFEVLFLAYAGNSPLYVYLLLDWLYPLEPDLVIYPINFIDFRLHRTYVLFPEGKNETVDEGVMIQDALTFGEAPQSLWIFPWETLKEVGGTMDFSVQARYFLAGIFRFYQTQDFYFTNLQNIYQHRFGRNTSYHAYMGAEIPEGVNALGWTGKKFSFFPLISMCKGKSGFWIEVTPFLLRKGEATIQFQNERGRLQVVTLRKPGWTQVHLDTGFYEDQKQVTAELSQVWYAFEAEGAYLDYHRDPMGVRLQQTFGLERPLSGQQYIRPRRTEDDRYIGMSDREYESYFYYRLLEGLDRRPGIGYLVALERAKKRIATESFRPLFHLSYLKKISQKMNERNIPIAIINNPENPISLGWYERSLWYKEYLNYLQSLKSEHVAVWDLKDSLAMQGFSDFHHFTYAGMEEMNSIYAREIVNLFSK
ncbi:MAG: hypothetical protein O9264_05600 [Leptospira sp.]|jgi:hypothetical protein|nr:hypothetical protein [Leptospira sp.]